MTTSLDEDKLDAALDDLDVDDDEERDAIKLFAGTMAGLSEEQQWARIGRILNEDLREQRRMNKLIEQLSLFWLIRHIAKCVAGWMEALKAPKVLVPTVAAAAFFALVGLGQGDRALDIAESLIERYTGADIHGHEDVEKTKARLKAKAKALGVKDTG